jgi:putative transposase
MKKSRFTEEQIVSILQQADAGAKVPDLCRKAGVSQNTFYAWRKKYGGMTVNEAKRARELEAENAKLKRLLADSMLENAALKDIVSRKW